MFNTNLKLPDPAGPTMWIKVIGNIILVNDLHAHPLAAPRRVCKSLFKKLCTNSLIHNSNPKLIETHLVKVKFEFLQVQAAPPLHLWTDQNASPLHLKLIRTSVAIVLHSRQNSTTSPKQHHLQNPFSVVCAVIILIFIAVEKILPKVGTVWIYSLTI